MNNKNDYSRFNKSNYQNIIRVNKEELIDKLAIQFGYNSKVIKEVVDSQFKFVADVMRRGEFDGVSLPRIGKFHAKPGRLYHINKSTAEARARQIKEGTLKEGETHENDLRKYSSKFNKKKQEFRPEGDSALEELRPLLTEDSDYEDSDYNDINSEEYDS